MKDNVKKLLALLLAMAMVMGLGCAAFADEEPAEQADEDDAVFDLTEEELAALKRIGEETEECAKLVLLNDAEGDIMSVNIRAAGETEWSLNLLEDGELFQAEEMVMLCFEPEADTLYDIQFVFSNYTGSAVHDVDFADVEHARLCRQWNGLTYLVYTSVETGEKVDTSEAEQARAEADLTASVSGGSDEDTSSSGNSGGSGWTGGWTGGWTDTGASGGDDAGASGGDEGCLDDGLFW